jgi:hypothetical protein
MTDVVRAFCLAHAGPRELVKSALTVGSRGCCTADRVHLFLKRDTAIMVGFHLSYRSSRCNAGQTVVWEVFRWFGPGRKKS